MPPKRLANSVRLAVQMQPEHAAFHSVVFNEPIAHIAPQKKHPRCHRATPVRFLQILVG